MLENLLHHSSGTTNSPINPASISNEVQEKLTELKVSRQYLARLMNLETWVIVNTMDDVSPGFWHRFMSNRQLALKNLMQQQKDLKKDH